jgi:aminoglycoside phosphotransferase (APT) family kinase protein
VTAFDPAPASLAAVTSPEWLTAMLAPTDPGAVVREVAVVETLVTVATKVRLAIALEQEPAPIAVCIKGMLTDGLGHPSASLIETRFYRELASGLGVRVPDSVHAALNEDGSNGVVVMRDVIAAGGRFLSALQPFSADEAADGLDALARLHVAGWQGTSAYETAWVPRFLDRVAASPLLPQAELQALLDGPRGDPLPAAIRDAGRLHAAVARLAAEVRERPNCLVHGDAHAGNVYRDADGRLGVVDWQILQKGEWAQDVAYHIAAVLTPEDRRAHERGLIDIYLERLAALGGPAIDREGAWARYRKATAYGYYLWAITRKVDPAIMVEFVRRLGLAVADHGAFALLGV